MRPRRLPPSALVAAAAALLLGATGCGTQAVSVPKTSPLHDGAVLFSQRCSGCHTLTAAGTEGSGSSPKTKLRTAGPNLDQRKETLDNVLYAIRNGGFSGAIMPQNIVVGPDAQKVAHFVAKYSGTKAKQPPSPRSSTP
jgi:mono/diheme cytochrome c family protein